jgi:hypothetical protein
MSFILKGPYPAAQTTTLLPSPKFGDSQALAGTVQSARAMDGTTYTYVKSREGRKKFNWQFEVSRHKALELREFINAYQGGLIITIDHDGDRRIGYLVSNPYELAGSGKAGDGWPGGETMTIIMEFEER